MANPFRSLSNAPPSHWADATSRDVEVATTAIEIIRIAIEDDPVGPTTVVAGGPFRWRQEFMRALKGYRLVTPEVADPVFRRFKAVHDERFPGLTPTQVLDLYEPVLPPTQAEIDAAWEVTDEHTEDARRVLYGRDGHPALELQKLIDPKANDPLVVSTPTH